MGNSKKKFRHDVQSSEEVLTKESLIKSQEKNLKEFNHEKTQLSEKEEIYNLKVSTLQIIISKNEKELSNLERELSIQRVKNAELQNYINETEHQIQVVKDSIELKNTNITDLITQIEVNKKGYNKAKNELTELNEMSKQASRRHDDLTEQLKHKKQYLQEIEIKIDAQNKQLNTTNDEVEKLFFNLLAEQKKESSLKNQKEINHEKIVALETEVRKTNDELSKLDSQIQALNSEIAIQDKSITSKKQHLFEQRKEFDRLIVIATDKEDIASHNRAELDELERKFNEINSELLSKRDELTTKENKIQTQTNEIREQKQAIEDFDTQITQLKDEIEQLESKFSANKAIIANDSAKIASLRKQNDELETNNLHLREGIKLQNETKSHKETEILKLKEAQHELQESYQINSDELDIINETNQELTEKLMMIKEEKANLEAKLAQKTELLEEQTEYLNLLSSDLVKLEEEVFGLKKESNEAEKAIEAKKEEIFKLDQKIKDTSYSINKYRENIQTSLDDSKEIDFELKQKIEDLLEKEQVGKILSADVKEYVEKLGQEKKLREKSYIQTMTTVNALTNELKGLSHEIQSSREHIRLRDEKIDQKNHEIERLTTRLKETRDRNKENRKTISNQKLTIKELEEKVSILNDESISLIKEEEALVLSIDKSSAEMQVKDEVRLELYNKNQAKKAKVKELNSRLAELQDSEMNHVQAMKDYKINAHELTKDIKHLETAIADYEAKINIQRDYHSQNSKVLKSLTSQNQIMIEKINKLSSLLEDYETKNKLLQQHIASQKAVENENNVKLRNLSLSVAESGADYEDVEEIVETGKGLDVNIEQQIHSLETSLEKKFFNLTFTAPVGDLSFIKEFDVKQMNLFEEIHNRMLETAESDLSKDAEFYVAFDVNKLNIRSSVTISNLENIYNEDAKRKFIPVTSGLLKKYKKLGLTMSFRAKMKPNGTIDKIMLIINVPLKQADQKTIELNK